MATAPIQRYQPKGSITIRPKGINAVAFAYTMGGKPAAIAYSGNRRKSDWHHGFRDELQRAAYIQQWVDGLRKREEEKQRRQAERKSYQHGFQVGDILEYTWGYEQTNVEFFQVVALKGKQIVIREIAARSEGNPGGAAMSDRCVPVPDDFTGPEKVKTPRGSDGRDYVSMEDGSASKWDGKPTYRSWYA